MSVSKVSPALANTSNSVATNSSSIILNQATSQLGEQQFMQLLLAQLQNQDPLNPVNESDFTTQLAQLSQLNSLDQLNSNISQLMLLQGLGQGSGLIGKTVTYTPSGATAPQSGVVSAVNVVNNQVQLQVGSTSVPLSQVNSVLGSS